MSTYSICMHTSYKYMHVCIRLQICTVCVNVHVYTVCMCVFTYTIDKDMCMDGNTTHIHNLIYCRV